MEESTKLTSSQTENKTNKHVPLSLFKKIFFSFGHFSNDLGMTVCNSYLLIYFTDVAQITSVQTGYLLFLGQVADAMCTLAIGYESDRISGFCGYTKRNSWHLIGAIMTNSSFMFLFLPVLGGSHASDYAKVIYYAPIYAIYQMGWAFIQNSHLTLVSELTQDEQERVSLNGFRHATTLLGHLFMYCLVWFVFNKTRNSQWSPNDTFQFEIIAFTVVFVGSISSILYHVFTKEPSHEFHLNHQNLDAGEKMLWQDWFKEIQLYLVGLAYTGARLIVIVSQVYWPLYINYTLHLSKKYSAIIPMVIYTSGFFTSISMKQINSVLGKKFTLLLGSLVMAACTLWIFFINESNSLQIFGPAILIGVGSTILFITTLSMISDVIGSNNNSGAFVFGILSFVEKLSSGLAFMIIQGIQPQCQNEFPAKANFFKTVMTWFLLACTLVCLLVFFALIPLTLGDLKKFKKATKLSKKESTSVTSFIK